MMCSAAVRNLSQYPPWVDYALHNLRSQPQRSVVAAAIGMHYTPVVTQEIDSPTDQ